MAHIYAMDGIVPVVDATAFVHPEAVLIGDVIVGADCYVGPCASLRGDFGRIVIEAGSNVQDGCVLHGFPGDDTVVARDAHIGHGAVLHGCRVGQGAMVGMRAVVMDGAEVGEAAIVAAQALVKAGMAIPPRSLAAGVPARVVRTLSEEELRWKQQGTAAYRELTRRCHASLRVAAPLLAVEVGRRRMPVDAYAPLYRTREGKGTA